MYPLFGALLSLSLLSPSISPFLMLFIPLASLVVVGLSLCRSICLSSLHLPLFLSSSLLSWFSLLSLVPFLLTSSRFSHPFPVLVLVPSLLSSLYPSHSLLLSSSSYSSLHFSLLLSGLSSTSLAPPWRPRTQYTVADE